MEAFEEANRKTIAFQKQMEEINEKNMRRYLAAAAVSLVGFLTGAACAQVFFFAVATESLKEGWWKGAVPTMVSVNNVESAELRGLPVVAFLGRGVGFITVILSGVLASKQKGWAASLGFVLVLLQVFIQKYLQAKTGQMAQPVGETEDVQKEYTEEVATTMISRGAGMQGSMCLAMILCSLVYVMSCKAEGLGVFKALLAISLSALSGIETRFGYLDFALVQSIDSADSQAFAAGYYRFHLQAIAGHDLSFLPMTLLLAGFLSVALARILSAVASRSALALLSSLCVVAALALASGSEDNLKAVAAGSVLEGVQGIREHHSQGAFLYLAAAVLAALDCLALPAPPPAAVSEDRKDS